MTPPQATPSGDAAARGENLAHLKAHPDSLDVLSAALEILTAGRPRTFADVPAAAVCRGSADEREQCRNGAGACPIGCFD